MYKGDRGIEKLKKLYEGPLDRQFVIDDIPTKRNEKMTHLSSRLLAVALNGPDDYLKIAPYFYIENWRDFTDNPYSFELPELSVSVLDYGAKGDAFTDDTRSIQAAIDDVSSRGGGRVVLPGDSGSLYERRYGCHASDDAQQRRPAHRKGRDPVAVAGRKRLLLRSGLRPRRRDTARSVDAQPVREPAADPRQGHRERQDHRTGQNPLARHVQRRSEARPLRPRLHGPYPRDPDRILESAQHRAEPTSRSSAPTTTTRRSTIARTCS